MVSTFSNNETEEFYFAIKNKAISGYTNIAFFFSVLLSSAK